MIRITEGELKADIATARTAVLTLGLPGVTSYRKAKSILEKLGVKQVLITFDSDYGTNQAVATALRGAVEFFSKAYDVVVEVWPEDWGKGIDDILVAGKKPKQLRGKRLKKFLRELGPDQTSANNNRPMIIVTTEERDVNDEAVAALTQDSSVFRRGGVLVHVVADDSNDKLIWRPKGSPKIVHIAAAVLRERLAAAARWVAIDRKGELVSTHPPDWSVNAVYARGYWPNVRPLEGVVTGPVLRADGSILASSGYDPGTGLLCELDVKIPDVPIVKEYFGRGPAAEQAAREDAKRRAAREAERRALLAEMAMTRVVRVLTNDLGADTGVLWEAAMLAAGYRRSNYGPWRRRRERG